MNSSTKGHIGRIPRARFARHIGRLNKKIKSQVSVYSSIHLYVMCLFPCWHLFMFSFKKILLLLLPFSCLLSPSSLPLTSFTVKVILIKSSHRTELLIASRRSSWIQIQIKAHCLFQKQRIPPPPASPLFHHVKYSLSNIRVDCHSLTSASITLRTEGREEGESQDFSPSWSQDDFQLADGSAHMHARVLYLFRNVQPVILGSDKWGVHEVRSFYKYLCVCIFVSVSSILNRQQFASW